MHSLKDNFIPMSQFVLMGIFLSIILISCSKQEVEKPVEENFAQGEFLILEARWDEARNYLREFLLDNPNHPGAHFYLGRSYLLWKEDFRPIIAEGELQMALQLFRDNDSQSYIDRFPPSYFVVICNIESAKVLLIEFAIRQENGAPIEQLQPLVIRARRYVEAARKADPTHQDVIDSDALVQSAEHYIRMPR